MPGPRLPTDVVKARGKKHLSRAEEQERRAREVKLDKPKKIKAPDWLPEYLKGDFKQLAKALLEANLGAAQLDADTIGRYLVAQRQYTAASLQVQDFLDQEKVEEAGAWSRLQETYFKQCRSCANDMGLTVTSRCRLVVPDGSAQKTEENNPFLQLIQGGLERNA